MNDYISRQAAIDCFVTNVGFHDENGYSIEDSDELRKIWAEYFDGIPSVQPEYTEQDVRDSFNDGYRCGMEAAQPEIIRCRDCKYRDENWRRISVRWLPCMDVRTGSNWYCGSAERGEQ